MEVYCDNAATTRLDPQVLEAMMPYLAHEYGNPSSAHFLGRSGRAAVEQARQTIARLFHTEHRNIYFTSGATEANNLAIGGSIASLGIRHAISSPVEHHAVLRCLGHYQQLGVRVSWVHTDCSGRIDEAHLRELLRANPNSLVSLMHGNNEIGSLNDFGSIARLCQEFGAIFHSDTVQTVGKMAYDLSHSPVHFLVGSAHKFHGPKGIGFIYVADGLPLKPITFGGGQERGLRAGTENVAGIVGLSKALELAQLNLERQNAHLLRLKLHLMERLRGEMEGVAFNGTSQDGNSALPHILNVAFPIIEVQGSLLARLDQLGIAVSGGSACSHLAGHGSHVLRAIGAASNKESVRFSFSKYNSLAEVDFIADSLVNFYNHKAPSPAKTKRIVFSDKHKTLVKQ